MKRGKSSFINALLGAEIFPTGVLPVTAVITEIKYRPDTGGIIILLHGRGREQVDSRLWQITLRNQVTRETGSRSPLSSLHILRLSFKAGSSLSILPALVLLTPIIPELPSTISNK